MRRHYIVIPLAALLAISPLLVFGTSCGHDIGFHMQNWVEAAAQMRHGLLYPRWAFSPAWQAGEPRFTFYPPLSWMFGALLTFVLPMPATPNVFLYTVLVGAGFSMYAVARRFASPQAALIAACVYLANPYMFFNAFERSAYAELLASVWIPLLFLAVLRRRPSVVIGAGALALAWLTNVPAGIMATYAFVALAGVRLLLDWRAGRRKQHLFAERVPGAPQATQTLQTNTDFTFGGNPDNNPDSERYPPPTDPRVNAITLTTALLLGLALPAFYLLPAVLERRFVQASSVMAENLRYQDNFLFERTSFEPHNIVLHAASVCATSLLFASVCVIVALLTGARRRDFDPTLRRVRLAFCCLFGIVLFLLLPVSGFVWHTLPELAFLQFPWRLLTILSAALALSLAVALRAWSPKRWSPPRWLLPLVALLYVGIVAAITSHLYRQACEIPHMAQFTVDMFRASHGVPATDEYTPGDADNDLLRTDSPGYWLAPTRDPDGYAAGTTPNPNEVDPMFDGPIPENMTVAQHAPAHLELNLREPAVLVLNLRDFPDWRITRNGGPAPRHVRRDDGLTAIPLPAGSSRIDIRWHRGADIYAGDAVSLLALCALGVLRRRSRRIDSIAA